MRKRRPGFLSAVWGLCCAGLGVTAFFNRPAVAGPITTNTALPVHEHEFILRAQAMFVRSTGDPSPMDRELTVWAVPTVAVFGATEKLALFGVFPYLDKELKVTTPMGRRTRGDSGIGDFTFLARYTVGQWDYPGETLRLAPFAGLQVPTGEDDERDSLGRLPQPLQLGSGSWDPIAGTVFTWQTLDWEFDTSASYKLNTEANDFEFGDVFRLDLSFQYRLWPWTLEGPEEDEDDDDAEESPQYVPGFFYGVLECNFIWQDRNEISGSRNRDSGGFTWFLAPGIQYVTRRFILEAAVQLPVVQELNGNALENVFIVTAGFRVNF